jgi:hypothetical protein
MLFSAVSVAALCFVSLSVSAHAVSALNVGNAVKYPTVFTFDLFSGPALQDETSPSLHRNSNIPLVEESRKSNRIFSCGASYISKMHFRYPQPYEAQRVASTPPRFSLGECMRIIYLIALEFERHFRLNHCLISTGRGYQSG